MNVSDSFPYIVSAGSVREENGLLNELESIKRKGNHALTNEDIDEMFVWDNSAGEGRMHPERLEF